MSKILYRYIMYEDGGQGFRETSIPLNEEFDDLENFKQSEYDKLKKEVEIPGSWKELRIELKYEK